MARRNLALANTEIYHVLNRGVAGEKIFDEAKDYYKFIEIFLYYRHSTTPFKFSLLQNLSLSDRKQVLEQLEIEGDYWVEVIAFCLMPNHFHFLLRQLKDGGIMRFMRAFSNSYSHYFNTFYERKGPLFEGKFKALRVGSEAQLLHLSRYIHLNPYSASLVKDIRELERYDYSSLPEYLGLNRGKSPCQKEMVLSQFKGRGGYRRFVFDRADYQRSLQELKSICTLE